MKERQLETPVILIIFNRPHETRTVFAEIAKVKPRRLLVISDGPRAGKQGEADRVEEVRQIATDVTWPCTVETNFAPENLGCRQRLISGLDWAFNRVEEAIVLEDDVVPDVTFFPFCEEMLVRFRDDCRVSMISGFNVVQQSLQIDYSYFFSQWTHIWGWATWRRAWRRYDRNLTDWPEIKRSGILREILPERPNLEYWTRIFDKMHGVGGPDTWDYQWCYTNLINRSLAVVPKGNLVRNIGFGPNATHTLKPNKLSTISIQPMEFPLQHPPTMIPLLGMDRVDQRECGCYVPGFGKRSINQARRIAGKLYGGWG